MRIRHTMLILFVACSFLLFPPLAPAMGKEVGHGSHAALVRGAAGVARARYLVLIVLDGARPDYFGLVHLPHVDALRAQGTEYTNAFDGILESETPSGHTTLATGSTPRRDGILGFSWAENDNDFSLFSPTVVRAGAMEQIMRGARVPTIAGLYKARYPRAKVVALSGHKYYAADPLGGPKADAIMYYQTNARKQYTPTAIPGHLPPVQILQNPALVMPASTSGNGLEDSYVARLAVATFGIMRQRITLMNVPEFDWPLGHVDGGNVDRTRVITYMQAFDRDLGTIEAAYRKAGVLDKTLFVITADHGMAPVTHFMPYTLVTQAIAQAHARATSIGYNHSVYIWLQNLGSAPAVAANLVNTRDPGIASVYYLAATGSGPHYVRAAHLSVSTGVEAANQYLLGTLMNGHEPAVVAFARDGATFSSSATHWRADHGGPIWQSQHIPLILAGPGIRRGFVTAQPAQLDDVAPSVLSDMGVASTGMEGRVLADALVAPAPVQRQARAAEVARVSPVVTALKAQDAYEQAHPLRQ